MIFWVVIGGFYLTGIISATVYARRYCKHNHDESVKHESVKHTESVKHESVRPCRWVTNAG